MRLVEKISIAAKSLRGDLFRREQLRLEDARQCRCAFRGDIWRKGTRSGERSGGLEARKCSVDWVDRAHAHAQGGRVDGRFYMGGLTWQVDVAGQAKILPCERSLNVK